MAAVVEEMIQVVVMETGNVQIQLVPTLTSLGVRTVTDAMNQGLKDLVIVVADEEVVWVVVAVDHPCADVVVVWEVVVVVLVWVVVVVGLAAAEVVEVVLEEEAEEDLAAVEVEEDEVVDQCEMIEEETETVRTNFNNNKTKTKYF